MGINHANDWRHTSRVIENPKRQSTRRASNDKPTTDIDISYVYITTISSDD